MFREEKSIPLDKITDLTLKHGPVLRALGLVTLHIETAGQSTQAGAADAKLTGVVEARRFRDSVLEQRDRVAEQGYRTDTQGGIAARVRTSSVPDVLAGVAAPEDTVIPTDVTTPSGEAVSVSAPTAAQPDTVHGTTESAVAVLIQIRDALHRIEDRARRGAASRSDSEPEPVRKVD